MIISKKINQMEEKERERLYQSIWDKSLKMESVIKDILSAASLTSRKYQLQKESVGKVNMLELVLQIVDDFRHEADRKEINFSLAKERNESLVVQGIKEDLKEAISNLVNNAFKYIEKDDGKSGSDRCIGLKISKHEDKVLISVKDNGIGIPKEEIPKLFQKFFRASNARKIYTDGSGLGLFIVKEIIEGHGGKVWVESELNRGTEFYVSLPRV